MDHHGCKEFEENEQEMIALFRLLSPYDQRIVIGYTKASVDIAREKALKKIIQFPGSK